MEGLDMDNILSPDEVESLFTSDGSEETQVTPPEQQEEENKEKPTTEVPEVNPDELFTEEPESVGSEKVDTQGKEDTTSKEETGTSPKTNFYSSIASALKEEGILSALDEETLSKIQTPEDFAEAMENELKAKLDERQKRIDEALQVGIEPDEVRKYEGTINYLNTITEDAISDESANGEKLRKQLIFQDFLNRGFSKERAQRETQKSFNSGSDVEDAKEALASNKEYFQQEYEDLIAEARAEEEAEKARTKKEAEELKKSILDEKEIFKGLELDKTTREKVYNSISKPVYKDPETGQYLTAIQKYERDNRQDFLKKIGLLFTMTDGFTNLDKLVKPTATKQVKKSLRELEHTINTTRRNTDGSLSFISGVSDDPESKVSYELDI
jgi:hypothetical protein|nr:MAG TPA: hypothetical protein [Caudoviricetes sp.]